MENASKALLIAGAILLCILIIAIGMFIYNNAQGTIVSSLNSLSTQEVESFNNQFMTYQGVQKGTNVKNLMGKLIANANTFADEPNKVPYIRQYVNGITELNNVFIYRSSAYKSNYIDYIGKLKSRIKTNKEYKVVFNYQKNGLIDWIIITDKNSLLSDKYIDTHSPR